MGLFDKRNSSTPTPPPSIPTNPQNGMPKPPVGPGMMPPPGAPRPPMGPNMAPQPGAPRPMGPGMMPPKPNSGPTFGPNQPSSFPPPSQPSFDNQFSGRGELESQQNEFLQENNLVNEILSVNLNEGRVARRQLSSNTPAEEVRQYLANLVARKQQLTNYENQLKDRKKVIDEIIERKGLSNKKKVKPKKKVDKKTKVASSTTKDTKEIETVGSTNAKEVKSKKLVTTKKTSVKTSSDKKDISVEPKKQKGKDLVVVTKTSKSSSSSKPKQKTLKVVNHKMTANLEKLGKVNKAKKPSAIITKKKTETKASSNTKKKTTKTTNSKTKSKNK